MAWSSPIEDKFNQKIRPYLKRSPKVTLSKVTPGDLVWGYYDSAWQTTALIIRPLGSLKAFCSEENISKEMVEYIYSEYQFLLKIRQNTNPDINITLDPQIYNCLIQHTTPEYILKEIWKFYETNQVGLYTKSCFLSQSMITIKDKPQWWFHWIDNEIFLQVLEHPDSYSAFATKYDYFLEHSQDYR